MNLATFTNGTHSPGCSGCPVCSALAAAILANPTNPVLREAMGRPALRTLAERELRVTQPRTEPEDFTPVNSYAADIAKRRQADETPESRFAEQHAAERTRELEAEYAANLGTAEQSAPRVMSAAELEQYAAPDPWAAGIRALQEENRR